MPSTSLGRTYPLTTTTAKSQPLPVSLAEAKAHLRVLSDDLDDDVQATLDAAADVVERDTARALRVSHTVVQTYDRWPCSPIRLERQPAKSVSSLKYYDSDDSQQTVASSNYRLLASTDGAALVEIDDDYAEPTLSYRSDAVELTYLAGYSALTDVPPAAIHAIKMQLSILFGDLDERQVEAARSTYEDLIASIAWGAVR